MSRSSSVIAENIIEQMRLQGVDAVTIPWNKFYRLVNRERIHHSFMSGLQIALHKRSFLMAKGHAVITIVKDFNFCELEKI